MDPTLPPFSHFSVPVMYDGTIAQGGHPDELFANPATQQVRDFHTHGRLEGLQSLPRGNLKRRATIGGWYSNIGESDMR
jgi:ABC-type proline/glycine betaine transport system ATPase subunit